MMKLQKIDDHVLIFAGIKNCLNGKNIKYDPLNTAMQNLSFPNVTLVGILFCNESCALQKHTPF